MNPPVTGDAGTDTGPTVDQVVVEDTPEQPVDIGPLGELQPGDECSSDNECATGICVRSEGLRQLCGSRCATDNDCNAVGREFNCVVDRPGGDASRARATCAVFERSPDEAPAECESDVNCSSNVCLGGYCRNLCAGDDVCTPGWTCGALPGLPSAIRACRAAPITGVTVEDYTLYDDNSNVDIGTGDQQVVAPDDAVSLTWITQDLGGRDLFATVSRVVSPSGRELANLRTYSRITEQPIRIIPARFEIGTALLPSSNILEVEPGIYRSQHALLTSNPMAPRVTSRPTRAWVRIKRAPGGVINNGVLRVRFVFVGLNGINAASAPSNTRLSTAIREMQRIFAQVGVTVQITNFDDITGTTAQRLSVIDSYAELQESYRLTQPFMGDVLPIIFVRGISSAAGLENAIGIAGSIAGPPGVHGTVQSGVVVGWESTFGFGRDVLAITMAHECGHYLGLWHSRERLNACTTNTQQDCAMWGAVDPITDTPTNGAAEQNLMYYSANGGTTLSTGQGVVVLRNPLVR